MTDVINNLAAESAAAFSGGVAYTYAAHDALAARILVVEEGGSAFPRGSNIGAPGNDPSGKWRGILDGAGFEPGMYSWWNAIPCGLDREPTADDKKRGAKYLSPSHRPPHQFGDHPGGWSRRARGRRRGSPQRQGD